MIIKPLRETSYDQVIDCFFKVFENYFVTIPNDPKYFKKRWADAGVDFDLSYGMFEQDELIAFIIHAIDYRNGHQIAFNTGTGVLPKYRGQHIISSIYDYAIPKLKQKGITRCSLEVITDNVSAIKTYNHIGFEITKTYHCFKGTLSLKNNSQIQVIKSNPSEFDWNQLPHQHFYSWDHQRETIQKSDFDYYTVSYNSNIESYFIINSSSGYVAQCEVLNLEKSSWERLFQGIQTIAKEIKINNIDSRNLVKIEYLKSINIPNFINQYEMELVI